MFFQRFLRAFVVGLGLFAARAAYATELEATAEQLFAATVAGTPLPSLTFAPEQRTAENAYRIQALFFEKLKAHGGDTVAGFKAGLTAEPQMKRFGATSPAGAPLLESGKITVTDPATPVRLKAFKGMMLETELAFRTARAIAGPVKDVQELKALMASVHACIEVPQLFFADMGKVDFFEITASGIGSKRFIVGSPFPLADFDPDAVQVSLTHNGQAANSGRGPDALDGQWKALLWLVNTMREQGAEIKEGQYLLTGALGKMIPAQPGEYEADFVFEKLRFVVEE